MFGHAKQGASCGDTRAAGKQVLTNGPSTLAGAISPTVVPERSLGMRTPDARRFAEGAARMIDQPSLPLAPQAAQILGLVIAPTTGTRASPPAAPVSGSSWRSLRPGAIGAIDGHAWTLVRYPGAVDDPDAGEWISCRTRRNRLAGPSAPTSSTQPLAHLPCGNVGVHSAGALKVNHRIAVIPVATQSR